MDLGLTGRVTLAAAARKGISRAFAEESVREDALDVADSSAVAAFAFPFETRSYRLPLCVTNSAGPPSNLCKNTKPELWCAVPGQLPMYSVSLLSSLLSSLLRKLFRACRRTIGVL
jgi:hypothetical protein